MCRFRVITLLSLVVVATASSPADELQRAKDAKIVQTLLRLPGFDLESKPEAKAAVLRHLKEIEFDEKYLELIEKFPLVEAEPGLIRQMVDWPDTNLGVGCAKLLLKLKREKTLQDLLRGKDAIAATAAAHALGLTGDPAIVPLLEPLLDDEAAALGARTNAAMALGRLPQGEKILLARAQAGKLPMELKFVAANALLNSSDEVIRTEAAKHLSLPATAAGKPLPPTAELVKLTGKIETGKIAFDTKGTCNKCHTVNGQGKDVGPNLSEIGSKLSREAMFVSILDPSAGVSHNFETYRVVTGAGKIVTGILVSDAADAVTLKTADAIQQTIPRAEIEEMDKLKISLMPADLQKQLTAEELVDIVEYLTSLKKK